MPGDGAQARDGSVLAVGVEDSDQVWRWAPD